MAMKICEKKTLMYNSILFDSHYDRCLEKVKREAFWWLFFQTETLSCRNKSDHYESMLKNEDFDNILKYWLASAFHPIRS